MSRKKRRPHSPQRPPIPPADPAPARAELSFQQELALMDLLRNGQYLEIIQQLDPVPPSLLSTNAALALASSLDQVSDVPGTLNHLVLHQRALQVLNAVREKSQDTPLWFSSMGTTLFALQRDREALGYLRAFCQKKPPDGPAIQMVRDCRSRLREPVFDLPFRRRVELTWADLTANQAVLEGLFDDDASTAQSLGTSRLASCLFRVLDTFPCSLYQNEEGFHLALWTQGSDTDFLRLRFLMQHAPASLKEHWNFHVGQPPDPFFETVEAGIPISSQDVLVWAERTEDSRLRLRMYCRKLLPLIREQGTDSPQIRFLCRKLLCRAAGELAVMSLPLSELEVLSLPVPGEPFLLNNIFMALGNLGFILLNDADTYRNRPGAPMPLPAGEDPATLRRDIRTGLTWCPALAQEYLDGQTAIVEGCHAFSICPGFFCWPAGNTAEADPEEFRRRLMEALHAAAGEDAFEVIGWACGSRWNYLDILAWDSEPVLQGARGFFSSAGVSDALFHSFFPDTDSVPMVER